VDIFDQAQQFDAQFCAMSIDAVKRLAARKRLYPDNDCDLCGKEIPLARREAVPGCELCVDCQNSKERLNERR